MSARCGGRRPSRSARRSIVHGIPWNRAESPRENPLIVHLVTSAVPDADAPKLRAMRPKRIRQALFVEVLLTGARFAAGFFAVAANSASARSQ